MTDILISGLFRFGARDERSRDYSRVFASLGYLPGADDAQMAMALSFRAPLHRRQPGPQQGLMAIPEAACAGYGFLIFHGVIIMGSIAANRDIFPIQRRFAIFAGADCRHMPACFFPSIHLRRFRRDFCRALPMRRLLFLMQEHRMMS